MDKYLGRMLDNRYEILELIGTGGMSNVYKARCHRLNRLVAIKILKDDMAADADFRRRFEKESQAVAMLSHPNIMGIYDVSTSGDVDYIVMELLDGITLKQYIQRKGVLNWKEALHFTTQICKGLSHAHSRGIIHRDIKPHNIMILRDGSVKVTDFGIAYLSSNQNTLTQEALGSVHYISPEQAKGSTIDARSDIYSLGVVLYEMLTNRLPYEGDSPVAVAIQHINSIPLPPRSIEPGIPAALESITMKAMAAEPDKRYASAPAMLDDLEEFRKNPNVTIAYVPPAAEEYAAVEPTVTISTDEVATAISRREKAIAENIKREQERRVRRNKNRSARRVSTLAGIFAVLVFLLGIFYFLYSYFIRGLLTPTEDLEVPYVVGLELAYVQGSSKYDDFVITVEEYVYDSDMPDGTILTQEPARGRKVKSGTELVVTVSGGATAVFMPDVVGEEYRAATQELSEQGLYCQPEFEASDTVTSGYIIRTAPEAGTELHPGDSVTIYVSMGPDIEMVAVPNLSGYTQTQAERELEKAGLSRGTVREEYHEEVEAGIVFDQGVAAATPVPEGFAVDLWISKGPEEVEEDPIDPGTGGEPIDPGAGGEPIDPGAGGEPVDPGTGGEPVDPGTGGEPVDPGTGGEPIDPGTGGEPVDPGTGGEPVDPVTP